MQDIARDLREQARRHRLAAAMLEKQIARIEAVINAAQDADGTLNRQAALDALVDAVLKEDEDDD